jgi:PAS domain S-box-containing protein
MAHTTGFLDKLLSRLERLDPANLQSQFLALARERGLLETVFNAIQEGILVVSDEGILLYANAATETLLGLETGRLRGRSIARFLPEVDWYRLARQDEDAWARVSTSELEVTFPKRRTLSFYAVPLPGSESKDAPAVLAMLRDVTHQRRQEATMLESERFQALRFLAASVAHEIGNPLNALGIHLQLLERETRDLPEEKREHIGELVDVAREEVARLDLILSQFLGALGPSEPRLSRGNLARVLEDTLRLMKSEIENRRIEIAVAQLAELPEAYFDAGQMKQVFFNIIKNALQAMPDGGCLTIRFEADERNLTVALRDTGTGIPEEAFRRLFEPFRTTKVDGHGLGLLIVQRIVQDHGGEIEIASKSGVGTEFRIVLPLADRRIRLLSERAEGGAQHRMPPLDEVLDVEEIEHV